MNEQQFQPIIVEISKIDLGENDYLVLKFPEDVPQIALVEFSHYLQDRFPKLNGLIFHGDVEITKVHREP